MARPTDPKVSTLDLFLLLTAMLCGLTGITRPAETRAPVVEASQVIDAVRAIALAPARHVAPRPDGYVAPQPLVLDLAHARAAAPRVVPERRRE